MNHGEGDRDVDGDCSVKCVLLECHREICLVEYRMSWKCGVYEDFHQFGSSENMI